MNNDLIIDKTRCAALRHKTFHCAGEDFAIIIKEWLMGEPETLADELLNIWGKLGFYKKELLARLSDRYKLPSDIALDQALKTLSDEQLSESIKLCEDQYYKNNKVSTSTH